MEAVRQVISSLSERVREETHSGMQTPHFFPLGEGLELTEMERQEDQLVHHVMATSRSARCPLCNQPATRLHSRYRRLVKDLPCTGQQVQLILHARPVLL